MLTAIRRILEQHVRLAVPAADLTPQANLYALGLTPYSAVRILLAIEREFDIELPRDMLRRETMGSLEAIVGAVRAARASARPDAA